MVGVLCCCFFFSSRRRHTRSKRDWSSDVCSSDLLAGGAWWKREQSLAWRPHYGPRGAGGRCRPVRVEVHVAAQACLRVGMQGFLVVLVPVLLAGFALLMDGFRSAMLAETEQIDGCGT